MTRESRRPISQGRAPNSQLELNDLQNKMVDNGEAEAEATAASVAGLHSTDHPG